MNDKDMKKNGSKKNAVQKSASNFAIAGAQDEVVHRYGAAVKEHLVSYSGVDHETGQILKKSLDSISREKISVVQPYQSIKAQAGYAAEVKTVAQENAERIISGDKTRVSRTDDLSRDIKSASGQTVGGVNNQLFDIISIGEDGSYIEGSARQLK